MDQIEQARNLINELHKERITYDEYTLLMDAFNELLEIKEQHEQMLKFAENAANMLFGGKK